MPADRDRVLAATRHWLERFVIGLNLCPFAAAPFRGGRIRYEVCEATQTEGIYQAFLQVLDDLVQADPHAVETALLVVPDGLQRFDEYLDMLALLEAAIGEAGLDGVIQVASFHPDYLFADAPADDPANFTNRSPYPMFHLIREDGLTAALEGYVQPERIPQRNVERLRQLGVDGIRRLLADDSAAAVSDGS